MTKAIYTQLKEVLTKYNLSHKITVDSEWINKKDTFKVSNGYIVVYEKGTHPVKEQIGWVLFSNDYDKKSGQWISDWSLNDHPYSKELDNLNNQ